MTTYISILRGINVSGQRPIKMEALKKMYEDLSFKHVQTYIQSGNVIFRYEKTAVADLERLISEAISKLFGFEVPVLILDIESLKNIIAGNPYITDSGKDISFMHVTFLSSDVSNVNPDNIRAKQAAGEDFTLTPKAVYLYCPHGYGRTKLTNSFFENKLKVSATTRNWKTANELLRLALQVENTEA